MKTNLSIVLASVVASVLLVSCSANNLITKKNPSNPPKEVQTSQLSDIDATPKIAPPGNISVTSKLADNPPSK